MKVYKSINAVQEELSKEGISKSRRNTQGAGYNFRGIDEVFNAISPLLAKHQLCILPRVLSRECVERQSKAGGALFYVTLDVEFDFVCSEDGSKHTVKTFGEAMDSGDKATNKAMSAAYKYACLQTFAIPTEGDNDADSHTHEVKPSTTNKAMPSAKPVDKPIVKPKVEEKPALVIDEGMPILEFAEGAFASAVTMSELKQWFSQLYTYTKPEPENQVIITNLYNSRKAELEKK